MPKLSALLILLTSTAAFAHEDHTLGDGTLHLTYHAVFWGLFAAVLYKGTQLYRSRKKDVKAKAAKSANK